MVGQQMAPGETIQIHGDTTISQKFSFTQLPFYSQLPKEAQVVLMVQGTVTGSQIAIHM
ncbi:MAG: hypothetical protein WCL18_04360 [bacterium]